MKEQVVHISETLTELDRGQHWSASLEAGVSAGVMYTHYKEYLPIDGHYV